MISNQIKKVLRNEKTLFLAYDQGLEHGPTDFNLKNIDPNYVLNIAEKAGFNAVILHHGIAEKYYSTLKNTVPLIIKLNGKTNIPKIEPFSAKVCSVKRAVKLGAEIVGYTIYDGSKMEPRMFREFGKIIEEAHDHGIPVVVWSYPRGEFVQNEQSTKMLAHAARVGLELGADFIKLRFNNDVEGFKWVVKAAGKAKVLAAGGPKLPDYEFLKEAHDVIQTGAIGLAVGRNIWQHPNPLKISKALQKIVFESKTPDQAMSLLK